MSQRSGWYDDPDDPSQLRYFDGILWTQHRQPKKSPTAERSTIGHAQPPVTQQQPGQQLGPYGAAPQQPPYGSPQQPPYGGPQPPPSGQQHPYGQPNPYGQQPPYGYGAPTYQGQGYVGVGVKTTPDGAVLAGWGIRLLARIVDGLITYVLTVAFAWPWFREVYETVRGYLEDVSAAAQAGAASPPEPTQQLLDSIQGAAWAVALIGIGVGVVYHVGFLTTLGATPGKLLCRLRVRRRDRPGKPDLLTALRRQVVSAIVAVTNPLQVVGLLGSVLWILDYLWPLWDDKNQALHDKVAGTNVVVHRPQDR